MQASLFRSIGAAVATEFRVYSNREEGNLSIFAPNVNIFRDGRWGRGQETAGEDPHLMSLYTVNYVRGMQEGEVGEASGGFAKTLTTCKHFAAYDLENYAPLNGTVYRQYFNAIVTDQDMADTFLPPFRDCIVEGRGAAVMFP